MTLGDLKAQAAAGNVTTEEPVASSASSGSADPAGTSATASSDTSSINQYVPIMVQLQSTQQYLSAPPTFIPQTFEDQIQFVYDGTNYFLYFYANNHWSAIPVVAPSTGIYGDGSDGALHFDGSATVLGMVPSGGTYTLTRDIFATTIILDLSATFKPTGFKIYASESISISGTLTAAGGNGGNGTPGHTQVGPGSGPGGAGGSAGIGVPSGSIKQPGNGAAGTAGFAGETIITPNSANGANGTNEPNCILPNSAAAGGNSQSGSVNPATGSSDNSSIGGAAGTATQTTAPHALDIVFSMLNGIGAIGVNPSSGSGAGGGGGAGVGGSGDSAGGGGGGGGAGAPGGCVWLASPSITVNASGTIDGSGGTGGTGGAGGGASGHSGTLTGDYSGGGGGGGGGGNGGLILLITPSYSNNGTVKAAAGLGGAGGSGASGGGNGHAGLIVQISP